MEKFLRKKSQQESVVAMKKNTVEKLIGKRKKCKRRLFKKIYTKLILLWGADIPSTVTIGENVGFAHNALGTVINSNVIIEDNVSIYHNVTIGRADVSSQEPVQIVIGKGAVICAGAKILANGYLKVGENSIIAANAVLLQSTGDYEMWGGTC